MKILNTKIKGPKIIRSKIFKDKRGYLRETFRNYFFKNEKFPFDVMSFSKKNVLRGLHIQLKKSQSKIITVTQGKIFDVAVDLRKNSKTFGKHVGIVMSDKSDFSFYIPKNFAHGFICLSNKCTINYKNSNYRHASSEISLNWADKKINIKWPVKKPVISNKDKNGIDLKTFINIK